jgi:hypothetical protein
MVKVVQSKSTRSRRENLTRPTTKREWKDTIVTHWHMSKEVHIYSPMMKEAPGMVMVL